jgi:T5orf172 domain
MTMTFIYFAQIRIYPADRSGLVKIGRTTDVEKRIQQLNVSVGEGRLVPIRLLAGFNGDEKRIHKELSRLRVQGEWFAFAEEMLTRDFGAPDAPLPELYPPRMMFKNFQAEANRRWRERRRKKRQKL